MAEYLFFCVFYKLIKPCELEYLFMFRARICNRERTAQLLHALITSHDKSQPRGIHKRHVCQIEYKILRTELLYFFIDFLSYKNGIVMVDFANERNVKCAVLKIEI